MANKIFSDDIPTPLTFKSINKTPLLSYFKQNKRFGIGVSAFVLAATLVYSVVGYQPKFSSSATVLIKNAAMEDRYVTPDAGMADVSTSTSNTTNPILNTMGLLKTDSVRDSLWFYLRTQHPEVLKKNKISNHEDWIQYFGNGAKFISAKNLAGTDFISLKFSWNEAVIAHEGLDTVLAALRDASRKLNQAEQHERAQYLDQQIEDVRGRLDLVRGNIRSFKQQTRLVDIGHEEEGYARNRIEMETLLANINSEAASKQNEMQAYQRMLGMSPSQAVAASALGGNENLTKLQEQLYSLRENYKSLRVRYTDEHPKVMQLREELSQVEKNLGQESRRTLGRNVKFPESATAVVDRPRGEAVVNLLSAKAQSASLNAKANTIRRHLQQLDGKLNKLPELEKNLAELKDEESILSESLKRLEQKMLEANIREMQTLSNVFVLESPSVPQGSDFPKQFHIILLGLFMSVISGVAAIYLKRQLEEKRNAFIFASLGVRSENGTNGHHPVEANHFADRFAEVD